LPIKPHDMIDNDTLAQFVEQVTDEKMPKSQIMAVLDNLVESPKDVCDLYVGDQRAAVGILIYLQSETRPIIELTIIPVDDNPFLTTRIYEWSQTRLKGRNFVDFEIPIWQGSRVSRQALLSLGFSKKYTMYNMEVAKTDLKINAPALPDGWCWVEYNANYFDQYHEAVTQAFDGVTGAHVPNARQFAKLVEAYKINPQMLMTPEDEIAGFVRVGEVQKGVGGLSSLGRRPRFKGLGLGPILVAKGLEMLRPLRPDFFVLEVAARNEAATRLYEQFGFGISGFVDVYSRSTSGNPDPSS